jgi:hypothetical protein
MFLKPKNSMADPKLLLSILSVVWVITVGLFIYIIKMKDTSESATKQALAEIKLLIGNVNVNIATLTKDVDNTIYITRQLDTRSSRQGELVQQLQLKVNTLTNHKVETERRLTIVEKIINTKRLENG